MRYDMLVVDLLNLAHRVYHTSGDLSTVVDGVPDVQIGMVYGFVRSCLKLYDELAKPRGRFILCDEGDATERKLIWDGYKKNRSGHKPEFDSQLALLREMVTRLGWMRATSPGWEGDDVVATIADTWGAQGKSVGIVTADHDLHQCVTENVHVVDPGKMRRMLMDGTAWRRRDVEKYWGVQALYIPDVKALAGDSSDGYPGLRGVGDKMAIGMIKTHGDLATVMDIIASQSAIDWIDHEPPHRGMSRKTHRFRPELDMLQVYLDLATVRRDVPLAFATRNPTPNVLDEFRRLRFNSLTAPSSIRLAESMAGH